MSGAGIILAVNIAVASMFAASYVIVALTNRSQRAALWFGATYVIGMISPIGDFLSAFVDTPRLLEWMSYAGFLAATLSMSASFTIFHGQRPSWRRIGAIFVGGLISRVWIWGLPNDTLAYNFAYQIPLAIASLQAVRSVLQVGGRNPFYVALATIFGAIAASLMFKPFLAVRFGSGTTLQDYSTTSYALMSQASTGFLLLAAGIVLLLIVAQRAISMSQQESETDTLSGLANRRGFDRKGQELCARAARRGQPVAVAVFDLDHFKQINDTYGHQTGDTVIASFGMLLRENAPADAVVGRLGGEEFAMLIEDATAGYAHRCAEQIRGAAQAASRGEDVAATVSGGVAQRLADETLAELLRRADQALYQAKNDGRDRIYGRDVDDATQRNPSNVLSFARTRRSGAVS